MRLDTVSFGMSSTSIEVDSTAGAGVSIDTGTTILTQPSLKVLNPATSSTVNSVVKAYSIGSNYVTFRFYILLSAAPGAATTIAYIHSGATTNTTVPAVSIRMTTAGKLQLYDGATQVTATGGDSSALTADGTTLYRVDVKHDATAASGSRTLEARLNGSVFASTSTSTVTNSLSFWGLGANLGNTIGTTSIQIRYGGIAICDNTAGPGEEGYATAAGKITYLRPGANGDSTGFGLDHSGSGGSDFTGTPHLDTIAGTASGAVWTNLDDAPTTGQAGWITRELVAGSAVRGFLVSLVDPVTGYGLSSSDTVTIVHMNIWARADANTSAGTRDLVATVKSKASGTLGEASGVARSGLITSGASTANTVHCNTNSAFTLNGVSQSNIGAHTPVLTTDVSPHSSTPITVTGSEDSLASMQFGWRADSLTGSTSVGYRVGALWVVAETVTAPVTGTAAMSGGGTAAITGTRKTFATSALSGGGNLAISGTRNVLGTLALAGSGTLHASQQGVNTVSGTLLLSGGGTLTANGSRVISGTLLLSGTGTAALSGVRKVSGTLSLAGGGTAHFDQRLDVVIYDAGGAWSSGSVLRLGGRTWAGTAALPVTATFAAAGHKLAPHGGLLVLSGGGTMTAAGRRTVYGTLTLSGGGAFRMQSTLFATADRLTLDRDNTIELDHASAISLDG